MKKLALFSMGILLGNFVRAQNFILPTSTEAVAPSVSGSLSSATSGLTNDATNLSNSSYSSSVAGQEVKVAGWSREYSSGPGGGFAFGYDISGVPFMTYATALPNATDVRVGIVEQTAYVKVYAVVAFYDNSISSYVCNLYQLSPSTATLVDTKVLMASAYNRLSMDILVAKNVVLTWSDGADIYTATAKINGATDKLDFSPGLSSPAIKLTGGAYNQTLPDVGIRQDGVSDSVYYAFYNDSAAQVNVAVVGLDDLYGTTSATFPIRTVDYNTVGHSEYVELDVPQLVGTEVWAYVYADGYVKVRRRDPNFGVASFTLNNGSLPKGPAAMSVTGADYHPVISYPVGIVNSYAVGWTTTRATNPYAYPHSTSMVYVFMTGRTPGDSLFSKKDYQLINSFPGATSPVYVNHGLAFSTVWSKSPAPQQVYAVYTHTSPAYPGPLGELVHKNHLMSNNNSFKLAAAATTPSLSVGPNPSSHYFQLFGNTQQDPAQQVSLSLNDMVGHSIMQYSGSLPEVNARLKTVSEGLQSGTYIIQAVSGAERQDFKVQKIAE